MSGILPSTDEIVEGQACVTGLFDDCVERLNISIQNCGHYNLYYLIPTSTCYEAYCFGRSFSA